MKKNRNNRAQWVDVFNIVLFFVNVIYIITNLLDIDFNAYEPFHRAAQTLVIAIITIGAFLIQIWSYRNDACFFRQFFWVSVVIAIVAIGSLIISELVTHSVLGITDGYIIYKNRSVVSTRYYFVGLVVVQIIVAFLPIIKSAFNINNMSKDKQGDEEENKKDK